MSFAALKFTNVGEQMHAEALTGKELKFTKIEMGDGALAGESIAALTGLISTKITLDISSVKRIGNAVIAKGTFSNVNLTSGFYWRELGLFVADPNNPNDRSKDILYGYQNAGDLAEYIPAATSSQIEKIIVIPAKVGNAENVTAIVGSQVYVTVDEVNDLISEGTSSKVGEVVNTHNTSNTAHGDIRQLITGLMSRLNALADSDDTTLDQLSELVAYIKANRNLIESVTTSKVSVTDIVDNLTTNVANKPLSAAQGVAIKALIDVLQAALNSHNTDTEAHADIRNILAQKGNTQTTRVTNVSIPASAWASDTTFTDYPYKATLSITGVTATMECKTFLPDHTDADLQYLFAPWVNTGAGTLEVWVVSKPTAAILIELITFEEVLGDV